MTVLFISDLHLDAERPAAIDRFLRFIEREARDAEALYILGDLFEAWIGDDEDEPGYAPVIEALASLRERSVPSYLMHGNRDFLIGPGFAGRTGCALLGDYELVEVAGEKVLLTHGDLLCTDDEPYMALRAEVRDAGWQRAFLARPIEERRAIARELRERSRTETAAKPEDIMDVNQRTVEEKMRRFATRFLLHGHTHRPGVHAFSLDGERATRIVLGAWHEQGSVVRWDARGFRLETLP